MLQRVSGCSRVGRSVLTSWARAASSGLCRLLDDMETIPEATAANCRALELGQRLVLHLQHDEFLFADNIALDRFSFPQTLSYTRDEEGWRYMKSGIRVGSERPRFDRHSTSNRGKSWLRWTIRLVSMVGHDITRLRVGLSHSGQDDSGIQDGQICRVLSCGSNIPAWRFTCRGWSSWLETKQCVAGWAGVCNATPPRTKEMH